MNFITPKKLLEMLRDKNDVIVEFIKKDSTIRKMKATLNIKEIPEEKYPKQSEEENKKPIKKNEDETNPYLRVFDKEKSDWRGFRFSSILKVVSGGKTYFIEQEKDKK